LTQTYQVGVVSNLRLALRRPTGFSGRRAANKMIYQKPTPLHEPNRVAGNGAG